MDSEIYEQAHNIMRERRCKDNENLSIRIDEINRKIPEIKAINEVIFNTGKEIISLIAGGKDVRAEIEKMKLRNNELKNKAKGLLLSHGFPGDYLEMKYFCPKCSDTGYNNDEFCECMKSVFGRLEAEKVNKDSALVLRDFDSFRLDYYGENLQHMQKIFGYSKNYADSFSLDSDNIIMAGSSGLGKTHLSLAIANAVIQKGFSVVYNSAITLLYNIENERYDFNKNKAENTLTTLFDADLVIIDDLGTEQDSKLTVPMIYNIINTRINSQKPTIISTNLTLKEIGTRYGARTASRLGGDYQWLNFAGKDIRLQKRMEKMK